jgi:hypothetical protein
MLTLSKLALRLQTLCCCKLTTLLYIGRMCFACCPSMPALLKSNTARVCLRCSVRKNDDIVLARFKFVVDPSCWAQHAPANDKTDAASAFLAVCTLCHHIDSWDRVPDIGVGPVLHNPRTTSVGNRYSRLQEVFCSLST